jgi:hypothetical protein
MMIHLQKICALMILSMGIAAMTQVAYAASSADDSASAKTTTQSKVKSSKKTEKGSQSSAHLSSHSQSHNGSVLAGQTDIVAKVDLPMVTNITPWRDADDSIPKNFLEFSVLKDSLTPTDRDRLAGEIRYTSILNQPLNQK